MVSIKSFMVTMPKMAPNSSTTNDKSALRARNNSIASNTVLESGNTSGCFKAA